MDTILSFFFSLNINYCIHIQEYVDQCSLNKKKFTLIWKRETCPDLVPIKINPHA